MKSRIVALIVRASVVAAWLAGTPAFALQLLPDGGRWVNPNEPGRNFNIEIQDNQLTLVTQLYENGVTAWFFAQGTMDSDYFYGTLQRYVGGQCMTCSYTAPTMAGTVGDVEIWFTSPQTATLSWPGGVMNLVHRDSGVGQGTLYGILGEWATTEGSESYPAFWGERYTLNQILTDMGTEYVAGYRSGDPARPAVAQYWPDLDTYSVLLDASESYYYYYEFSFYGQQTIRGYTWVYLKGSSPSGDGMPFVASRMKSAAYATTGNGPGMEESELLDDSSSVARQAAPRTSSPEDDSMRTALNELKVKVATSHSTSEARGQRMAGAGARTGTLERAMENLKNR